MINLLQSLTTLLVIRLLIVPETVQNLKRVTIISSYIVTDMVVLTQPGIYLNHLSIRKPYLRHSKCNVINERMCE